MVNEQWVRGEILDMRGYAPGEQPRDGQRVVKLNTNENPFPPPDAVLAAIAAAVGPELRLYPEPSARTVREAAAAAYGLQPDQVVAGNGSDDLLTMIMRTFVGPGEVVAAPDPTYTLYQPLTQIQGGRYVAIPWEEDGGLPVKALLATRAKVTLIARPNAPTGHVVALDDVETLCRGAQGVVVLDEAYGDFAEDDGRPLLDGNPNLIIIRSFSKSLALAGMRLGLGFMAPLLAHEMHKVRDSYNVDRLAQVAAVAALNNLAAYAPAIAAIKRERQRVSEALTQRGFLVPPSQANFILAEVPTGRRNGGMWLHDLKQEGILVRHFGADPRLAQKLRITIGTWEEMSELLAAVDRLLESN